MCGGGEDGEREREPEEAWGMKGLDQKNAINLFVVLILYIKFQVPILSCSLVRSNGQEMDITPAVFYGIQSKINQVILTLTLNNNSKFQDPGLSNSLDSVLTMFS